MPPISPPTCTSYPPILSYMCLMSTCIIFPMSTTGPSVLSLPFVLRAPHISPTLATCQCIFFHICAVHSHISSLPHVQHARISNLSCVLCISSVMCVSCMYIFSLMCAACPYIFSHACFMSTYFLCPMYATCPHILVFSFMYATCPYFFCPICAICPPIYITIIISFIHSLITIFLSLCLSELFSDMVSSAEVM